MSKIVSVQDISCYGQCSITVALPILSAYGIETAILPSAILSNHTADCFNGFTVLDLTEEMPKIVDRWRQENIRFDAIYTGYIGDARQFDFIRDMKDLLNEGSLVIVDPAMADNGKLYSALGPDIVAGMRRLVAAADIIMPNLTEAALLLDIPYNETPDRLEVIDMATRLADMGPETVILTGVSFEENNIGAVAYSRSKDKIVEYFTERIPKNYHGTGDVFSSVLVAKLVSGQPVYECLKAACDFVVEAIKETIPDSEHVYGVKFEHVLAKERL